MTKQEALGALAHYSREQEIHWMIHLGSQLTIAARGYYPFEESLGDIDRLRAFNEMQHQTYGRIRQLGRGEEWTQESFLDTLYRLASFYQIDGDLRWAMKVSLPTIR